MKRFFPLNISELFGCFGVTSLIFTLCKEFGSGTSNAAGIGIIGGLVIAITVSISRLWQREGDRFRLILNANAHESIHFMEAAQNSISVTHFTAIVPSNKYTTAMLEKLEKGVPVVRIVGQNTVADTEADKWLQKFRCYPNYSEFVLPPTHLPFDFALYDDKIVAMFFPSSAEGIDFNQALEFKNQHLVLIFKDIFERIKSSATKGK